MFLRISNFIHTFANVMINETYTNILKQFEIMTTIEQKISLLNDVYETLASAAHTFENMFQQTVIDLLKTIGEDKINVENTFLKRPVEITDDIVKELRLINLAVVNGELMIEYEHEIYETFHVLTPTEIMILYIVIFEKR